MPSRSNPLLASLVFGCAVACSTACGGQQKSSNASGSGMAASGSLSDPQIAAIVVAANQVDIDAGTMAKTKSANADVKEFADRMMVDHAAVNTAAVALVTRLGVTPEESDASRGLISDGAASRKQLEAMSGAEFDRAYVDHEVGYHKVVLDVLDTKLVPSAQNPELKKMLVDTRPAFVAHLEHAKKGTATRAPLRGFVSPRATRTRRAIRQDSESSP